MKNIIFIGVMLFTSSALAWDNYPDGVKWKETIRLSELLKVESKVLLSDKQKELILTSFNKTIDMFFEYQKIPKERCGLRPVLLRVVPQTELDNREYFPNEYDYSDSSGNVVGRYFRHPVRHIYMEPDQKDGDWGFDIAHEVIHYINDACLMYGNDKAEHELLHKLMKYIRTNGLG